MSFDLERWTQVADLVGAVAIVWSLIYLAIQIRQNTRSSSAQNYAHALDRVAGIQARMSEDQSLIHVIRQGVPDPARAQRFMEFLSEPQSANVRTTRSAGPVDTGTQAPDS